jgi:hypothetical protein
MWQSDDLPAFDFLDLPPYLDGSSNTKLYCNLQELEADSIFSPDTAFCNSSYIVLNMSFFFILFL